VYFFPTYFYHDAFMHHLMHVVDAPAFNIEVHELVYVYSFLVDRIIVSNVPRATVHRH